MISKKNKDQANMDGKTNDDTEKTFDLRELIREWENKYEFIPNWESAEWIDGSTVGYVEWMQDAFEYQ